MFKMGMEFVYLALTSLVIGILFGLLVAYILKIVDMKNNSVKECVILITSAYLAYLIAEFFYFSGIIVMFSCGFTMAHYAFYNISSTAQRASIVSIEMVSSFAESFLYIYLGLSALYLDFDNLYPAFIILVFFATAMARFISVCLPIYIVYLSTEDKSDFPLKLKDVVLIAIGGIIKGAIECGMSL